MSLVLDTGIGEDSGEDCREGSRGQWWIFGAYKLDAVIGLRAIEVPATCAETHFAALGVTGRNWICQWMMLCGVAARSLPSVQCSVLFVRRMNAIEFNDSRDGSLQYKSIDNRRLYCLKVHQAHVHQLTTLTCCSLRPRDPSKNRWHLPRCEDLEMDVWYARLGEYLHWLRWDCQSQEDEEDEELVWEMDKKKKLGGYMMHPDKRARMCYHRWRFSWAISPRHCLQIDQRGGLWQWKRL